MTISLMKTFILIYKAMLLYTSAFSWIVFLMGADSIFEENKTWFFVWLGMNLLFVWLCRNTLSYRDIYKLSGMALLDRFLNNNDSRF